MCATLLCEWDLCMERGEVGFKGERNLRCGALSTFLKLAFEDKTIVIASVIKIHVNFMLSG